MGILDEIYNLPVHEHSEEEKNRMTSLLKNLKNTKSILMMICN